MSEQKLKNVIKKHQNRKIICVFVFFCTSEEKNRKKKRQKKEKIPHKVLKTLEKIENSLQGNDGGLTKLANVLPFRQTKTSLLGPVKKVNCLDDTKNSFPEPFKPFIFY